jgi:hypothetical protein
MGEVSFQRSLVDPGIKHPFQAVCAPGTNGLERIRAAVRFSANIGRIRR